ncbi:MAG TPA: PAS domain S-box protein [Candidatus Latescibacteria bacterium]|nr:PAS domain S-box protein [Candidatus Latescibacterota bacterium]
MNRIVWKLFLTYVIVVVLCLGIVGIYVATSLKSSFVDRLADSLTLNARLVEDILREDFHSGALQQLRSSVKGLAGKVGARITIIRTDGVVLADSEKDAHLMDNHWNRPEVQAALRGETGRSIRYSGTLKRKMMYLAVPLEEAGSPIGVVRLALPLTEVQTKIAHIYRAIAMGALLAFMIALIIGFLTAETFARPLRQMMLTARDIAQGKFRVIKVRSKDEIGQLAGALNQMSEEIQDNIRTLAQEKNELRAILSSMAEGVIVVDKDEKILLINSSCEEMLGLSAEKVAGKFLWEVARKEELISLVKRVLARGDEEGIEMALDFPETRVLYAQVAPILSEGGNYPGVVVVFHDITKLKQLEKQRREFVVNVSHELKTPLTSIKGFVETLVEGGISDPENSMKFLKIIQQHTERLDNLVNDLLELSSIESGELPMNFEKIRLKELIAHTVASFSDRLSQKNQLLNIAVTPEDLDGWIDEEKMHWALSNLLDNAHKYTPSGGQIEISATQELDRVKIEVSDNGEGIPKEHLPRIFERFYRVDKARSRQLGGTGLGLAIVKHIVLAHGGEISVESKVGVGTTFTIYLPRPANKSSPVQILKSSS